MIKNPFTPSEIASHPEDFFGRSHELSLLERSIMQGSIAIHGPIGIGKSSLLSRTRLLLEGFGSSHKSVSAVATGHKDIANVDEAARLLLSTLVNVDETSRKVSFKIGKMFGFESSEICRNFSEGRHLSILMKLLEHEHLNMLLNDQELLILAFDEADKCPIPLTRMIRILTNHLQQIGVKNVRFITAGVTPYFQIMSDEDPGISRFFFKNLLLSGMSREEALDLLDTKLKLAITNFEKEGSKLRIDPIIIERIIDLSAGHPHLLQLLGAHIIEHEIEYYDGILDLKDLITSLRSICYEDRAYAYTSSLHFLELNYQYDNFKSILGVASSGFPTMIDRTSALNLVESNDIEWLVNNNYLTPLPDNDYGLVDEFLRIRILFDEEESEAMALEKRMVEKGLAIEPPRNSIEFDDEENEIIEEYHKYDEY